MALLNSDNYGDLAKVSSASAKREPGKFFSVFITGAAREGQEFGKLQCMPSIDSGTYLINNESKVYFIPYFTKRFWEKYVAAKGRDGKDFNTLVAFGWDDDVKKLDDTCKYAYVIAGVALDPKTKKALTHPKDIPDAKIKQGDPIMIFFKCAGMRFNGASEFIKAISEKAKNLPPLSDKPEFERLVVMPRRFISYAEVVLAKSDFGDKQVFSFTPEIQLPDKAVEQVMNSAVSMQSEFEKQFDRTSSVKGAGTGKPASDNSGSVPFESPGSAKTQTAAVDVANDSNFDLGI